MSNSNETKSLEELRNKNKEENKKSWAFYDVVKEKVASKFSKLDKKIISEIGNNLASKTQYIHYTKNYTKGEDS